MPGAILLLAGLATSIHLASLGIPDSTNSVAAPMTISASLAALADDFRHATGIQSRSSTAITLSVADRDGDGQAETIRYLWSGTAGTPVYYQFNSEATEPFIMDVSNFVMDFTIETSIENSKTISRLTLVDIYLRSSISGEYLTSTGIPGKPQVTSP
jgi:hypothetical protein